MNFNGTLFREVAHAMKANGLQASGYTLINVGGNGHNVNGSISGRTGKPVNCSFATPNRGCYIQVRNSTGHLQIDPARFPGPGSTQTCLNDTKLLACLAETSAGRTGSDDGPPVDPVECGCVNGNVGLRALAAELRAMGYQWGRCAAPIPDTCSTIIVARTKAVEPHAKAVKAGRKAVRPHAKAELEGHLLRHLSEANQQLNPSWVVMTATRRWAGATTKSATYRPWRRRRSKAL